jgi:hypothetical protein
VPFLTGRYARARDGLTTTLTTKGVHRGIKYRLRRTDYRRVSLDPDLADVILSNSKTGRDESLGASSQELKRMAFEEPLSRGTFADQFFAQIRRTLGQQAHAK